MLEHEKLQMEVDRLKEEHKEELKNLRERQKAQIAFLQKDAIKSAKTYRQKQWQKFLVSSLKDIRSQVESEDDYYYSYQTKPTVEDLPKVGLLECSIQLRGGGALREPRTTWRFCVEGKYTLRRRNSYTNDLFVSSCRDTITDKGKDWYGQWSYTYEHKDPRPTPHDIVAWIDSLIEEVEKGKVPPCPCFLRTKAKLT